MKNFKGSPSDPVRARVSNAAAAGDTVLVGAVAGLSVRVYGLRISAALVVTVSVKDGASNVLEVINLAAGRPVAFELREDPYYTTSAGNALVMNCSAPVQVDALVEFAQGK